MAFSLGVNSVLKVLSSWRDKAGWRGRDLVVIGIVIVVGFFFVGLIAGAGKALLNRGIFGFKIA